MQILRRAGVAVLILACAAQVVAQPHYAVHAKIDQQNATIAVDVTATFPDAAPKRFVIGDSYVVDDRRETAATLSMRYHGPLSPSGDPPLNVISSDLVELNLDSLWLPLVEGFSTRFTVDATIEGLDPQIGVVAQGRVRRAGRTIRIHRDVADIDLAFVAMRGMKRAKSAEFELYAPDVASPAAQIYEKHGPAALAFLQQWFGPMPNRPVRLVVVRRKRASGYARRGYIVVTDQSASEQGSAKFLAHEMAHAWWSPVDPTTEHRWLQESLAEYVALRYVESVFGVAARNQMLDKKRVAGANATSLLGHGVRTDAELYAKGPVLLFDLEERIGRAKLDRVLHDLAPHPPAVTSEFMKELAAVAGEDAARDFEQRLRQ